jgi:hypothetical protein
MLEILKFNSLIHLSMDNRFGKKLIDYELISNMRNLESLSLFAPKFDKECFEKICANLYQLEKIEMYHFPFDDFSALSKLGNLKSLTIIHSNELYDIPIMDNIKILSLEYTEVEKIMKICEKCKNISNLDAYDLFLLSSDEKEELVEFFSKFQYLERSGHLFS